MFADDTSLFSVVRDIAANDLRNISKWVYQWKILFNPDLNKQAQEATFRRKLNKPVHPNLTFNNSQVGETESQKYLGLILDNKQNLNKHLKDVFDKILKTIGLILKLQLNLSRFSWLTISKTFVRSHIDYGERIYDKTNNVSFHRKLKSIKYFSCLTITGTTGGTSYEK